MTDKELRKLNRIEMIELLLEQSRTIDKLEAELKEQQEKFEKREITIHEAGNIAEASLRLNHIFEDAQAASEQYINGLKALFLKESGADKKIIDEYEAQIASENGEKSPNIN
jgi:multidrug resistance efflux pump